MKGSVVILICALGIAVCAEPPKCCGARQFEVQQAEVGGAVIDEHGHQREALINTDNVLHFDYYNETAVYEVYKTNNGVRTLQARIIQNYKNNKRYVISGSSCRVEANPGSIGDSCVPASAQFLGTTHVGFGSSDIPLNTWVFPLLGGAKGHVRLTLSAHNCVPFVQSVFSEIQGERMDTVVIATNFHPGIRKHSVFTVPTSCQQSNDQPQPRYIRRAKIFLDALFTR